MNLKFEVLALDLDGTLTNDKKIVTQRTKNAVENAIKKGTKIVLASGRPILGIREIAKELKLYEYGGYILGFNGSKIIECKSESVIYSNTINGKYVYDICRLAHHFGLEPLTYTDKMVLCENKEDFYVKKEAFNNSAEIMQVDSIPDFLDYDSEKFMIVGEPDKVSIALPELQKYFGNNLNIFCSESYFIEVMPPNIEKAVSMNFLLNYLGLTRDNLMACGDGLNDIPLIKLAKMGVAMGNAYDDTKAIADFISEDNNNDGVAVAIEKFIL